MTVSAVGGSSAVGPTWTISLSRTNSPPSAILRRVGVHRDEQIGVFQKQGGHLCLRWREFTTEAARSSLGRTHGDQINIPLRALCVSVVCFCTQQIRGNCSPLSMSTTRRPPMRLRRKTLPGRSATTSPMIAVSRPSGWPRMAARTASAASRRDDDQALALVRHVERIEAEDFARAAHLFLDRDAHFVQQEADAGLRGDLVQAAGDAAAGRIAQHVDASPPASRISATSPFSAAESLSSVVSNSSPSRTDMIAMPWLAIGPLIRTTSPGRAALGRNLDARRDHADAGRIDEDAVSFAALDHFRVAGDDAHARGRGRRGHRLHDAPQLIHRQPFLQDEAGREIERPARRTWRDR